MDNHADEGLGGCMLNSPPQAVSANGVAQTHGTHSLPKEKKKKRFPWSKGLLLLSKQHSERNDDDGNHRQSHNVNHFS